MAKKSNEDEILSEMYVRSVIFAGTVISGHKYLKAMLNNKSIENEEYKRFVFQGFCYGIVNENIRNIHNLLLGVRRGAVAANPPRLVYSSKEAYEANKNQIKCLIEHTLPVVEFASKWFCKEKIDVKEVIDKAIFAPLVMLTKDEAKSLDGIKTNYLRKYPDLFRKSGRTTKTDFKLANTNPDYEHPFRRYETAGLKIYLVANKNNGTVANTDLVNSSDMTYAQHLENMKKIDIFRKLYEKLDSELPKYIENIGSK